MGKSRWSAAFVERGRPLLGGALTLLLLSFRTLPLPQYLAAQGWVQRLHDKKSGVPYGIALAAAALLVYPDTLWMQAIPA